MWEDHTVQAGDWRGWTDRQTGRQTDKQIGQNCWEWSCLLSNASKNWQQSTMKRIYYLLHVLHQWYTNANWKKQKKEKETNTKKYNKCTVNKSHNLVHKQLTIVCTSDFKNQLSNKTKPSLINMQSNSNLTTFFWVSVTILCIQKHNN